LNYIIFWAIGCKIYYLVNTFITSERESVIASFRTLGYYVIVIQVE